jgi:hypothetical protein
LILSSSLQHEKSLSSRAGRGLGGGGGGGASAAALRSAASRPNIKASGGRNDSDAPSMPPMKQLIINMKSFVCPVGEDTELKFFLYQKSKEQIMSDQFQVMLVRIECLFHDIFQASHLGFIFLHRFVLLTHTS